MLYVALSHSYVITHKNIHTESEGIVYLLESDTHFFDISSQDRKMILERFSLPKNFSRSFDLVWSPTKRKVLDLAKDEYILVELKTTKKYLPNFPKGFFFGATENEFELAKRLGSKYKFAFVSLHSESNKYEIVTLSELNKLVTRKRIQYQINF